MPVASSKGWNELVGFGTNLNPGGELTKEFAVCGGRGLPVTSSRTDITSSVVTVALKPPELNMAASFARRLPAREFSVMSSCKGIEGLGCAKNLSGGFLCEVRDG